MDSVDSYDVVFDVCAALAKVHRIGSLLDFFYHTSIQAPDTVVTAESVLNPDVHMIITEIGSVVDELKAHLNSASLADACPSNPTVAVENLILWVVQAKAILPDIRKYCFELVVASVEDRANRLNKLLPKFDHICSDLLYRKEQCKRQFLDNANRPRWASCGKELYHAIESAKTSYRSMIDADGDIADSYSAISSANQVFLQCKSVVTLTAHLNVIQSLTGVGQVTEAKTLAAADYPVPKPVKDAIVALSKRELPAPTMMAGPKAKKARTK